MLKRYHHIVGGAFRAVDALIVGLAWLAAYTLRFDWEIIQVTKGLPAFETYAALTPLIMILWAFVFSIFHVYSPRRMLRRTHEVHQILKAHFAALVVFIFLTYLFSEYRYSRGVMLTFGAVGGFFLVVGRLLIRNTLRSIRRKGFNLRYLLAVGEGPALEHVIERLEKFPELGVRVMGVVVSESSRSAGSARVPVLGRFSELRALLTKHRPDQIVISLPREQAPELDGVLRVLGDETADLQLIPDIQEYVTLGCQIEEFDGIPLVKLNDSPLLGGWGAVGKRMTDVVVSFLALVFLSPLLALIAIGIRLTSPGAVLYSQERMGMDGRTFRMLKFRSMRLDAEAQSGAVWAKENDPRRTAFGSFLRKTSLDELPQFFNVLMGDMSLVGPRPERPVFVEQFRGQIPYYMLRHKVKAGITGWAQVNGWRGNTSLERRIECDLYYIRNWSYALDWKILWLTLWNLNKNAY